MCFVAWREHRSPLLLGGFLAAGVFVEAFGEVGGGNKPTLILPTVHGLNVTVLIDPLSVFNVSVSRR